MEKIAKIVFVLLLLSIASVILCQASSIGDPCDQDDETGSVTLEINCPYFEELDEEDQHNHLTKKHGFKGRRALICCKGFGVSGRSDLQTEPTTTEPNYFTTPDPIPLDDGIESLCDNIGPYPGLLTTDRIIGGTLAEAGEFPHFASLAYRNRETNDISFGCGGALISHRHVLTAAHCFKTKDMLEFVRLGSISNAVSLNDGHVDIPVEQIIQHPEYKPNSKYHDIAILKLQEDVTFSFHIWAACLTRNSTYHAGRSLKIAGFGRTDNLNSTSYSSMLMKADVAEVPLQECREIYENAYGKVTIIGIGKGITDEMMCAKNSSSSADTCQGDSGSALNFRHKRRYFVVGVTSFGQTCGGQLPSFYTRVSKYIDWIEEVIQK